MNALWQAIVDLWYNSGLYQLCNFENGGWKNLIMILISFVLIYLAVKKGFEPMLLLPIAFGMLLCNLPHTVTTWELLSKTRPCSRHKSS